VRIPLTICTQTSRLTRQETKGDERWKPPKGRPSHATSAACRYRVVPAGTVTARIITIITSTPLCRGGGGKEEAMKCQCAQCQADRFWTPRGLAKVVLGTIVLFAVWGAMGAAYVMAIIASPTGTP
jgi:hypothetical protein